MKTKHLLLLLLCTLSVQWAAAQNNKNTETRQLSAFTAFNFYGSAKIYLIQGDEEKIMLKGKKSMLAKIKTEVRNGKLFITSKKPRLLFNPRLKIHIYYKNLEEVEIEGKAKIKSKTVIKGKQLNVIVMGSARIYLDVEVARFKAYLMGAGSINVIGKAKYQRLKLEGAGAIRAANLQGEEANVQINGAGNILVHATRRLWAGVAGVGIVRYKGNPESTKFSNDGIGSIVALD